MESVKQIVQSNQSDPKLRSEVMEKVLLKGDLSQLTSQERLHYYSTTCNSLGLNPVTKPFEYLNLNGKLILYATRACTEQLRQIHQVSVAIKTREVVENCFVVTASASLPNGRTDESIGAVSLENLKGENRSNMLMKAETKAKRRVTLSICGLTFLDESEVEAIAGARTVEPAEEAAPAAKPWRTFKEMLECFAQAKQTLGPDQETIYYSILSESGVAHANEFRDSGKALAAYQKLCEVIENFPPAQMED